MALLLLLAASGPLDTSRGFRHETHLALTDARVDDGPARALECRDCHASGGAPAWATERPGARDHAPCDRCHAEEYYRAPGEYCRVCHAAVDPLRKGHSPLGTYPRRGPDAQLVSAFDHRLHLDEDDARTDLKCAACHAPAPTGELSIPKHVDCARCHDQQAQPPMKDCAGCHAREGRQFARAFASNDVVFSHAQHLSTHDGQPVDCERCHQGAREQTAGAPMKLPRMRACAVCHDDAAVTSDRARMWRCTQCHLDPSAAAAEQDARTKAHGSGTIALALQSAGGVLAPAAGAHGRQALAPLLAPLLTLPLARALATLTDDGDATGGTRATGDAPTPAGGPARAATATVTTAPLPREALAIRADFEATRRPEDHTSAFRTRHARAAASPDAKCMYCHEGLSGSTRDACDDCHRVTRPRSHDLRFSAARHGRLAAARPQACATCHTSDQCTDCHEIAPNDHFPISAFLRSHAPRARANTRACLTCHSFESTCERCHSIAVGGAR